MKGMKAASYKKIVSKNLYFIVGASMACLLFVLAIVNGLGAVSALTDNGGSAIGYDYFGLPRCGLAIRMGTNPFAASTHYSNYGPYATPWLTHPAACIFPGTILSYLDPWFGYWLMNVAYLLLHLTIIYFFSRRIARATNSLGMIRDGLFFAALGFFIPWYTLYRQGQYHAFSVLALFVVLASPRNIHWGFIISALSKPVLGPAGALLILSRRWKTILWIGIAVLVGYLPWYILHYSVSTGLTLGWNQTLARFFSNGSLFMLYPAPHWNQHLGLASFLEIWLSPVTNYMIRGILAGMIFIASCVVCLKRRFEVAVCLATMWFFLFYAFGHEYHLTLCIPILGLLYSNSRGNYNRSILLAVALVLAAPTTYPILRWVAEAHSAAEATYPLLSNKGPILYLLFLGVKPLCMVFLAFYVAGVELFRPITK